MNGFDHESLNVLEEPGRSRWQAAGKPVVPSLVLEGEARPILHVSQLARWLDFPVPQTGEALALGWDLAAALGSWVELIAPLDLAVLLAPAEPRGRSLRNLTVNVFHPVSLLPDALATGRFPWDPDGDGEREVELATAPAVVRYAGRVAGNWTGFLLDEESGLGARDPIVASPRGELPYSELLESQRWHASFHLDQVEASLSLGLTPSRLPSGEPAPPAA